MEEHELPEQPTTRKKTGPRPKDLVTVEVTGYEVGRGITKRVVFDEDVYKLAAMGCSNAEISRWFNIDENTLTYNFSEIIGKGREHLKHSLRRAQIKLALSGNATMLIWLGKNILGQSDSPLDSEANAPLPWSDNE
jgi:hypothetical protein